MSDDEIRTVRTVTRVVRNAKPRLRLVRRRKVVAKRGVVRIGRVTLRRRSPTV